MCKRTERLSLWRLDLHQAQTSQVQRGTSWTPFHLTVHQYYGFLTTPVIPLQPQHLPGRVRQALARRSSRFNAHFLPFDFLETHLVSVAT